VLIISALLLVALIVEHTQLALYAYSVPIRAITKGYYFLSGQRKRISNTLGGPLSNTDFACLDLTRVTMRSLIMRNHALPHLALSHQAPPGDAGYTTVYQKHSTSCATAIQVNAPPPLGGGAFTGRCSARLVKVLIVYQMIRTEKLRGLIQTITEHAGLQAVLGGTVALNTAVFEIDSYSNLQY
jgi:hypothetical protein